MFIPKASARPQSATWPLRQLIFVDVLSARIVVWLSILLGISATATGGNPKPEIIRIGMSTALTGPASYLGTRARFGVELAFDEYNQRPGNSRRLELVVLDDKYEPHLTAPNMRKLIEQDQVAAVLGSVGAPCAVVAVPIAEELRTPLIGYITGGDVLRKSPPDRYVINFRASLREEAAQLIEVFVDQLGVAPDEIAFFTQRDAFGDAFFAGGMDTLAKRGIHRAPVHARYERNTEAVQMGVSDILLHDKSVKAIAIGAAAKPTAAFIRESRAAGFNAHFGTVSFVDATELRRALGDAAEGVVVNQVVPPVHSDVPVAQAFRKMVPVGKETFGESYISLEGFIVGRMLCRGLDDIEGPVNRERLTDALLGLNDFDLGLGSPLRLTIDEHQASHSIWPTLIQGDNVRLITHGLTGNGGQP